MTAGLHPLDEIGLTRLSRSEFKREWAGEEHQAKDGKMTSIQPVDGHFYLPHAMSVAVVYHHDGSSGRTCQRQLATKRKDSRPLLCQDCRREPASLALRVWYIAVRFLYSYPRQIPLNISLRLQRGGGHGRDACLMRPEKFIFFSGLGTKWLMHKGGP